jgi:hypothetical protein
MRLKKAIQELQKDKSIGSRLDVLEKKLNDDELLTMINQGVD